MPDKINQKNVYLLLPGKTARIASILAKKRNLPPLEALRAVYSTPLYRQLEQEKTKLWHRSPEQLYVMLETRHDTAKEQVRHGPGKSVLLPHRDMILDEWSNRRSARAIAEKLAALNVSTTPQNVWKFIKNHS